MKKILCIATFLLGSVAIVYGIKLEDIAEIIANATVLCLSCIGIG